MNREGDEEIRPPYAYEMEIEALRLEVQSQTIEVVGDSYNDTNLKYLLHNVFGATEPKPWAEKRLMNLLAQAVKERDRRLLQWVGRHVPEQGANEPKLPVNYRIAEFVWACLEDGYGGDRWFLPTKKDVAKILEIDIKRVSEFFRQLQLNTGIVFDERVVGNAWETFEHYWLERERLYLNNHAGYRHDAL